MIGERLQEVRKDHGDTQQSLADKLKVAKVTVQSWEQEKSSPNHEMLVAICKLYSVSSDYLLGLSDVDPVYALHKRDALSPDHQAILLEFERYLFWKQRKRQNEK